MTVIEAPSPTGWALNRSHPLSQGLISALVPVNGTRRWMDFATGEVRSQPAQFRAPMPTRGPYGLGVTSDVDSVDLVPTFTPRDTSGTSISTVVAVKFLPQGVNGYTQTNLLLKVGSVGSANQTHQLLRRTVATTFSVSNFGNDIDAANAVSDNAWYVAMSRYGAGANDLWVNGLRVGTGTAAAYAGDWQISNAAMHYCVYSFIGVWNRLLAAQDAATVYGNPFTMFVRTRLPRRGGQTANRVGIRRHAVH